MQIEDKRFNLDDPRSDDEREDARKTNEILVHGGGVIFRDGAVEGAEVKMSDQAGNEVPVSAVGG